MSDNEITISAQTLLFHIKRYMELGGVLPEGRWMGRWEDKLQELEDSSERFPMSVVTMAIQFAAQQLQDPILGLHHADQIDLPYYDFYRVLAYHANSLEEFVQLSSRYFCLFTEIGVFEVQHKNTQSDVRFNPCDRNIITDHQIDGGLMIMVKSISLYAGIKPELVLIDHAAPAGYEQEYVNRFGCAVEFDQPYAAVRYPFAEVVKVREVSETPLLLHDFEQQRDQLYGDNIIDKTEFLIRRLMIRGEPKREHIARELALSVRTFQRLLAQHDTTYKALLESTRKQMALEYIKESSFAIQEVALLLGYTETSQFYKAFRRWFDRSPGYYRKEAVVSSS